MATVATATDFRHSRMIEAETETAENPTKQPLGMVSPIGDCNAS